MKFYAVKEDELGPEFLMDEDSLKYYPFYREVTEPTWEQLAAYCDQEAENANYHDFVGAHREIALLIVEETDDATAARVLRKIAERGCLQEIAWN